MQVVSRWTMARQIKGLALWVSLGAGALGGLYYQTHLHQQALQQQQLASQAVLLETFRLGQSLAQYHSQYHAQLAAASQANPAALNPAWQDITRILEAAATQRTAGISASVLGEANDALKNLHQLVQKSLAPPAEESHLEWSLDKIQARLEVIEYIVTSRNKPAELNAWVELKRLQGEFTQALAPEALNRLANFTDDLISSFKLVVRPDATQGQLVAHLDTYRSLLKPQTITQKVALSPVAEADFQAAAQHITQVQQKVQAHLQGLADNAQPLQQQAHWQLALVLGVALAGALFGLYALQARFKKALALCVARVEDWQQGLAAVQFTTAANADWLPFCEALNHWLNRNWLPLQQQADACASVQASVGQLVAQLQALPHQDLTQKLPLADNITAEVSRHINQLTENTAKTLWDVQQLVQLIQTSLSHLQDTARQVLQLADDERKQVIATGRALEISAKALHEVARDAQAVEAALQSGMPVPAPAGIAHLTSFESELGQGLLPADCRDPLQRVVQGAMQQAELAGRLRDRAAIIRTYIEKTALHLNQQKRQADALNAQVAALTQQLDAFRLPGFYNGVRVTDL